MKPRFLIFSLTSCSGCISTLLSLDIFPQFLERTKVQYFNFISDTKEIKECDIALIEGCVSEHSQISLLKIIRKNAKKIYGLGTCAAFGGILSLSDKKSAEPISEYIEIDGFLPGCPPPSKLFGNTLIKLIENIDNPIILSKKNLCATCPLRDDNNFNFETEITKIYPNPDEIITPEENLICFLKNGILCLGPITREGCENICIEQGIPCEGCMGPVSKDLFANIINFLSLIKISEKLKNYKGVFYRFSKPKFKG